MDGMRWTLARMAVSFPLLSLAQGSPALADGEFLQLDLSAGTTVAVVSAQRGPLTFSLSYTEADGDRSGRIGATYELPLPTGEALPTARLGPALGLDGPDLSDAEPGLSLVLDRYTATTWGSVYLLADLSTIDAAWFLLAQVGRPEAGLTAELSRGGSDDYTETTFALSRRLGDGPVSLRAGYRFEAEEVFVGLAVNTF
jgi:hypothetical protein